ncbi:MAG: group II intron reverse transcriptase/maturase [Thiolinea sp.]
MTEVRSLHSQPAPDRVGPESGGITSLEGIAKKAKACKDHRFQNLYRCLDAGLLLRCWDDLNQAAASGVDKQTAEHYEANLIANLHDLAGRLKAKRYRAKRVRRCYLPKANGGERPLGIPVLEDRLVQAACARILGAIYEADFLPLSYGYRPGRSARDAVCDLGFNLQYGKFRHVIEADIKGFFDHLEHDWLLRMLQLRIDDQAFLGLIRQWLKAGILDTDGQVLHPASGTPQGGVISPMLANVYLHYVLDHWFQQVVKPRCSGQAMLIRYADDYVAAFQHHSDAQGFYQAMPARLAKFGLEIAKEKTRLLSFIRFKPERKQRFVFLGFEIYWGQNRDGTPRLKQRTARKKLQQAKRTLTDWIKANRHLPGKTFIQALNRKLVGHYNYFGLPGNERSLNSFFQHAMERAFKWLNRRGGKKSSFSWGTFKRALEKLSIAKPRTAAYEKRHGIYFA